VSNEIGESERMSLGLILLNKLQCQRASWDVLLKNNKSYHKDFCLQDLVSTVCCTYCWISFSLQTGW